MGLFSSSKSKKIRLPPMPSLGEYGQWAQQTLYGDISRAMQGGGLIPPNLRARNLSQMLGAYQGAYGEAKPEFQSWMNRLVPKGDVRVRGYLDRMMDRSYQTTRQDLIETSKLQPYEEQQEAMGMAPSMLMQEKRIGADITGMYNQYAQQQAGMPTFGSQLAYGLGSAGGWMAGAQRWAQLMSNANQGMS